MAHPWYWSKNRYEYPYKKVNPHFVHDNAKTVVDDILKEWKKEQGHRLVLVKAEMQSGKTSIMRHLCYMLNAEPQECANIGVLPNNVHIMCSIPDNMLVKQTRDRMQGVIQFPADNVHHSADKIWEDKKYLTKLGSHSVIILDESHWGTEVGGRIPTIFEKINCPLFYNEDNFSIMKKHDTRIVLITATPANELFDDWKCILTLKNDEGYYGVKRMLELNRIQDQRDEEMNKLFKVKPPSKIILQLFKDKVKTLPKQGNGFIIIRENSHDENAVKWVGKLKLAIDKEIKEKNTEMVYVDYNMGTSENFLEVYCKVVGGVCAENCRRFALYDSTKDGDVEKNKPLTGFDAVVNFPPDRVVIIFIKKALLAGKSLDTKNILMVIDIPCYTATQAEDTVAQGLVGRCCGYGKEVDNVFIVTNKKEVENYRDWVETGENKSVKPSGKPTAKSAFNAENPTLKPSGLNKVEDKVDDWDSDDEVELQVLVHCLGDFRESLGEEKFFELLDASKSKFLAFLKMRKEEDEESSEQEYSKPKKVIKNKKPETAVTENAEK